MAAVDFTHHLPSSRTHFFSFGADSCYLCPYIFIKILKLMILATPTLIIAGKCDLNPILSHSILSNLDLFHCIILNRVVYVVIKNLLQIQVAAVLISYVPASNTTDQSLGLMTMIIVACLFSQNSNTRFKSNMCIAFLNAFATISSHLKRGHANYQTVLEYITKITHIFHSFIGPL